MKKRIISKNIISISILILLFPPVFSQDYSDPIPFDENVTIGSMDNGLIYYIRENKKPENRAQLWLVVNAGSILENDDQQGLAHFTEHMAFNGTKHFEKHEIVDYLESIGMQFGPEINAYTGFDETVYMLQVPTDSIPLMEKAFQILEDWSRYISFEEVEINKERGVVIEEWRLGRGADGRMMDKQLPVIFAGSKYAERLPIGKKEILETFSQETIKDYYTSWYRPDLMAVIAVGDFDKVWILDKIAEHFGSFPVIDPAPERKLFPIPGHEETLFAIATDPEASSTSISLYFKMDPIPDVTIGDYRRLLIERLNIRMMNNRLYELLNQPEPPYLFAMTLKTNLVRAMDIYLVGAAVKEDGIESGLEAILTETGRVKQFGFTQTELDRTKTKLIRDLERAYNERDKTESNIIADECRRHFLESEPMPGIEFEYMIAQEMISDITLEEVNKLIEEWMRNENRVVLLNAPEKEAIVIPDESQLMAILDKVDGLHLEAYEDEVTDMPLVKQIPEPAKIIKETGSEKLNITEWELSNGVKVVLKPTDFKNDEIQFYAFSPGGSSLIETQDHMSARAASDIIYLAGVGEFDLNALNKKLAEKVVTVFPYINELTEGFVGNCTPKDMETMFQLIYAYMTAPRKDNSAFLSYQTRMKGFIENRSADPETAFYDTIMVTMAQYHPRKKPWSFELLDEIDPETTFSFYQDRFTDASDFTFLFVGNFEPEKIKPLVTTYLGGLPSIQRKETWKDIGVTPPEGIIKKTVYRGIEQKSKVRITFSGPMEWSRENNYALKSMASVMEIKLREVIREDLGGTYDIIVSSSSSQYPRQRYSISITFDCNPERVKELTHSVFLVLDTLQQIGPDELDVTKVRESQLRTYETNLKKNQYWINNLQSYYFTGMDPEIILEFPKLAETLSADIIKKAANEYLNMKNYVQVVLMPGGNTGDKQ